MNREFKARIYLRMSLFLGMLYDISWWRLKQTKPNTKQTKNYVLNLGPESKQEAR